MKDNQWFEFDEHSVLEDTTNNFINSGVIQLKIPQRINKNNTIMSPEALWIRATADDGILHLGKVKMIKENGCHATWNQACSAMHMNQSQPALSITRTKIPIAEIDSIFQPSNSFGGRQKENEVQFYQRLSERLRHKNRAINAIDYEELVLENFPEIFKVKCFMAQHTLSDNYTELKHTILPGSVKIVVVPDTDFVINKLYPRISPRVLVDIQSFIKQHVSPFVQVLVSNAFYERIRVICKVSFIGIESNSFYEMQLQQDIIGYLNPWMNNFDVEAEFGKSIFKSEVLAFIQKREYIDFVTEFSMVKILEKDGQYSLYDTAGKEKNTEEIKANYPWSILVSSIKHDLTIISDPTYESPQARGINNMTLETDFIISN